jgi:hypothetical protein
MDRAIPRLGLLAVTLLLTACGTTSRPLPKYETPLTRSEFQNVRTTAYTHTEADHTQYGRRNALGGTLRAAGRPAIVRAVPVADTTPAANPFPTGRGAVNPAPETGGFQRAAYIPPAQSFAPAAIGSAAADWSRWPAGTVFRIISTGQVYRVDDYGWALSGRNTIDLYMPSRSSMNAWAVRQEPIQILRWGDSGESLRILRPRSKKYRHIKRMVLELEGNHSAAAWMR